MNKKNTVRLIISAVLCIFLSLLIMASSFLSGFHIAFCKPDSAEKAFERSDYFNRVKEYIYDEITDISTPASIPPEIANGFVDAVLSDEMAENAILNIYYAEETEIDYENAREIIHERLKAYADEFKASIEIGVSEEEWDEIIAGLEELSVLYKNDIKSALNINGICSIMKTVIVRFCKLYPYLISGMMLFIIASLFIIWKINNKRQREYNFYALFCANGGIIFAFSKIVYSLIKRKIDTFGLDPDYFRYFIGEELYIMLDYTAVMGITLFVIGAVCGVLLLINKLKKGESK